jgi:hypothetical protein
MSTKPKCRYKDSIYAMFHFGQIRPAVGVEEMTHNLDLIQR